jgi:hypothetical protein
MVKGAMIESRHGEIPEGEEFGAFRPLVTVRSSCCTAGYHLRAIPLLVAAGFDDSNSVERFSRQFLANKGRNRSILALNCQKPSI